MLKNTKFLVLVLLLSVASASFASEPALNVPVQVPANGPVETAAEKAAREAAEETARLAAEAEATRLAAEAEAARLAAPQGTKKRTCPISLHLGKHTRKIYAVLGTTSVVAASVFAYVYSRKNAQKPTNK